MNVSKSLLTLKRLGLLPNERGWREAWLEAPPCISACSEVRRLIFSESKYFVMRWTFCKNKSKLFEFNCLNLGAPKNSPFQAKICLALISNFLSVLTSLAYKLPPWHFFIWGLFQFEKPYYLVKSGRFCTFFVIFWFSGSLQTFFHFFSCKKRPCYVLGKVENFQGRSVGTFFLEITILDLRRPPPSLFRVNRWHEGRGARHNENRFKCIKSDWPP